jgi:hypothetical protein
MKLLLEGPLANFGFDNHTVYGYQHPKPTISVRITNTNATPTEAASRTEDAWIPG